MLRSGFGLPYPVAWNYSPHRRLAGFNAFEARVLVWSFPLPEEKMHLETWRLCLGMRGSGMDGYEGTVMYIMNSRILCPLYEMTKQMGHGRIKCTPGKRREALVSC